MRIAISGSQRVGKSTLLRELATALADHTCVPEPYELLEEDGHEFAWPPSPEDFEAQLDRSVAEIEAAGEHALFERCPADLLAYLLAEGCDVHDALERSRDALGRLDLVVFVPIEAPDRIHVPPDEDREQRRAVDELLERLLLEDELADEVLVVHGDVRARVARVLARVAAP